MALYEFAAGDNNQVVPVDSFNVEEIADEDNNQVVPVVSFNVEDIEIADEDNNQITPVFSNNIEQIEVTDKDSMLLPLINMLISEQKCSIDEFNFLDEFSSANVILPVWNCSPRRVIEYIIETRLNPYPKKYALSRIRYKFKTMDVNCAKMAVCTFTDNMSLVDDIIIMCYLNCLESQYLHFPGIYYLLIMMGDKYKIEKEINQSSPHFVITWSHVLYSFPSIALACTNAPTKVPSSSDLYMHMDLLTSSIRKKLIWCYLIISVLPVLESYNYPITCLAAMRIELIQLHNKINVLLSTETQLLQVYKNVVSLFCSEAFPESLKLKLCERWDIIQRVKGQHNQFKYADYFEQRYLSALKFLSDLESQVRNVTHANF